ncbi:hypothetical protein [Bradyrhizobium sp.]|uniref:hypothetical protein n=1 Tax=Bradyrhizobium sp. TaxID=376 RepID=UPI0040376E00
MTIASLWLTSRKQVGKNCRTRQFRFAWREHQVAASPKNLDRNQPIESETAGGTALAW